MDRNRDGVVTLEEFMETCTQVLPFTQQCKPLALTELYSPPAGGSGAGGLGGGRGSGRLAQGHLHTPLGGAGDQQQH